MKCCICVTKTDAVSVSSISRCFVLSYPQSKPALGRTAGLLDILSGKSLPFFDELVQALKVPFPLVAEELTAEMKLELGTLEVKKQDLDDASALVHRHFGTSRRVTESEKKQIALLIAMKANVAREANKRDMARLKEDLDRYRSFSRQSETRIFDVNARIRRFIRLNDIEGQNPFIDMRSTTQALMRPGSPMRDTLTELEDRVHFLMSRLLRIAAEKDSIIRAHRRRKPSEQIRQGKGHHHGKRHALPVHALEHSTDTTREDPERPRHFKLSISDDSLRERVACLESELKVKDKLLDDLKGEVRAKQKEVTILKGMLQNYGYYLDDIPGGLSGFSLPHRASTHAAKTAGKGVASAWSKSDSNLLNLPPLMSNGGPGEISADSTSGPAVLMHEKGNGGKVAFKTLSPRIARKRTGASNRK